MLFGLDQPLAAQDIEGPEGVFFAQGGVFPCIDKLQGLDEKLDLPDASPSQLEVALPFALSGQAAVDLLLHHLDVLDHGIVEEAPVNEGLQILQQPLAERDRSGDGTGLEKRRPLPALPPALVIDLGAAQGVGQIAAVALGAQAQVDPEDEPVLGHLAERPGDHLGEFDEILVQVETVVDFAAGVGDTGGPAPFGGIEVDQVDIGGKIELPPPQLAHAEDGELRFGGASRLRLIDQGSSDLVSQQQVADLRGALQGGRRQGGEFGGGFNQIGQTAQVAAADAQDFPGLEEPQPLLQVGKRGLIGNSGPQFGQHGRFVLGVVQFAGGEKIVEIDLPPAEDAGQKRGGTENGEQVPPPLGIGDHRQQQIAGNGIGEPLQVVESQIGIGGFQSGSGEGGQQPFGPDEIPQQAQVMDAFFGLGKPEFPGQRRQLCIVLLPAGLGQAPGQGLMIHLGIRPFPFISSAPPGPAHSRRAPRRAR